MRMIAPCCVFLALLASCQTPTPREPQPGVVLRPYVLPKPAPPLPPRDKRLRQMQEEIQEQIEKTQNVIDSTRAPLK